ncbi:TonB-dependent receptor [Sphingoaurantiacus capsulatus]
MSRLMMRASPFVLAVAGCGMWMSAAQAQTAEAEAPAEAAAPAVADDEPSADEIIVLARRRSEQLIDVPAVVTAFTGEQLDRAGVLSVTDVARLTPQLVVEQNVSAYGGLITLRGVASPTSNTGAEPAVTINVDGVPISYGHVVRLGQMDLGQVEVLKGPQALFYGKNASGGIISLRSADPKDETEVMVRGGYEFKADEYLLEGLLSGRLTEGVRARVAVRRGDQKGYVYNDFPGVRHPRGPGTESTTVRGTLLLDPADGLTVRLKGTFDDVSDFGNLFLAQRVYCPTGVPGGSAAVPGLTDCRADNHTTRQDLPADLATRSGNPRYRDGVPYTEIEQYVVSADINYALTDGVMFNAISGWYGIDQSSMDQINRGFAQTFTALGGKKKAFSQEVRLFSDNADGAFNWMIGAFYQNDTYDDYEQVSLLNRTTNVLTNNRAAEFSIDTEVYSAFAQASVQLTDSVELSGGARYTDETKKQSVNLSNKFIPQVKFDNLSPEVTLSYKPDPDINLFASYKEGFKSGSFQITSLTFASLINNPAVTSIDNSYSDEVGKGFEIGAKALLLDRRLRLNAAAYTYNYDDLQVSAFDPSTVTTRISNAASSRVRGVEVDFNYSMRDQVDGLSLSGGLAFNRARYREFFGTCWVGQTIAEGCTIDSPDAGTVPDLQDLSGQVLPRAPKWSGTIGFDYEGGVGSGLELKLNGRTNYQSFSYLAQESAPWMTRGSQFLFDAGLAVGAEEGSWELALIGKNLTNKYYGTSGAQISGTGVAGTTGTAGPGQRADFSAVVSRGREVWLRLTLRPNFLN